MFRAVASVEGIWGKKLLRCAWVTGTPIFGFHAIHTNTELCKLCKLCVRSDQQAAGQKAYVWQFSLRFARSVNLQRGMRHESHTLWWHRYLHICRSILWTGIIVKATYLMQTGHLPLFCRFIPFHTLFLFLWKGPFHAIRIHLLYINNIELVLLHMLYLHLLQSWCHEIQFGSPALPRWQVNKKLEEKRKELWAPQRDTGHFNSCTPMQPPSYLFARLA